MATLGHLPHGRGYDTSLHYFHHANDYFTERTHNVSDTCPHDVYPMKGGGCFVDMWDTTRPAVGQNGTAPPNGTGCEGYPVTGPEEEYEEFKFKRRVISTIEAHDANTPLFMCYAFHIVVRARLGAPFASSFGKASLKMKRLHSTSRSRCLPRHMRSSPT